MTPLTISINDLAHFGGCRLEKTRIPDLARVLNRVPTYDELIPLRLCWNLPTTSIPDMWWSLRAVKPADDARRIAILATCRAARRVLHRVRKADQTVCLAAIEAAEGVIAGTHTRQQAQIAASARSSIHATNATSVAANAAAVASSDAAGTNLYIYIYTYTAATYAASAARTHATEREAQRKDLFELAGLTPGDTP